MLNQEEQDRLKQIVGSRVKAARVAAGKRLHDAQAEIGQKGITQLSLIENGERLPTVPVLLALSKLYVVPTDFLLGLINDPIADPMETNQGFVVNAVSHAVMACTEMVSKAIAEHACIAISGQRRDRHDLLKVCELMNETLAAYNRVKLLNPEFEEEWRGSATLEAAIQKVAVLADRVNGRIEHEKRVRECVERYVPRKTIENTAKQFMLDLEFT